MGSHSFEILRADLARPLHQEAVLAMMDAYSRDPMGDAQPLSEYCRNHLIDGLSQLPTSIVFLAMIDETPIGIATCFRGFSTFAAKPLINISDFYVAPPYRGSGIGRALFEAIESVARTLGCCRLTLEVQESNSVARKFYARSGFQQAVYPADQHSGGGSLYMTKPLA